MEFMVGEVDIFDGKSVIRAGEAVEELVTTPALCAQPFTAPKIKIEKTIA
jgi:hypothetical protein